MSIKETHNEIITILQESKLNAVECLGILATISFLINQQLKNETGVK